MTGTPMRLLRKLSLRQKLQAVIMLTVAAALLVACGALLACDIAALRESIQTETQTLARMIGENTTAALSFNDPRAVSELLEGLRAQPSILAACIYGKDGHVFASYGRQGVLPPFVPSQAGDVRSGFIGGRLILLYPVTLEGQHLGYVYLASELSALRERMARAIGIIATVAPESDLRSPASPRANRQSRHPFQELWHSRGQTDRRRARPFDRPLQ